MTYKKKVWEVARPCVRRARSLGNETICQKSRAKMLSFLYSFFLEKKCTSFRSTINETEGFEF